MSMIISSNNKMKRNDCNMSKQKKKRDDYKGYYPDEVKCGGKGGYGGNNRRNNNNSSRNNNNGYRKNTFGSSTDPIRTQRNNYTADVAVPVYSDSDVKRENTRPAYNKPAHTEAKKPVERTYKLPELKEEDGKVLLPIEFSRFGLSTIKMLTLGEESLIVIDGKFNGPKTALVINDRDPEKGFKAAVVLNEGDYVVITSVKEDDKDDVTTQIYKVVATAERPDGETKLGYATVEEMGYLTLEKAVKREVDSALMKVKDANYVYAKPKSKKVNKTNE